jgi:hypothetical protein
MNDYFRWSLRQFYLLYFWPSQLKREARSESELQLRRLRDSKNPQVRLRVRSKLFFKYYEGLRYMIRLLPFIVAIVALLILMAGGLTEIFGFGFNWASCWTSVICVMLTGLALGPLRLEVGIGICGAGAAGVGIAFGGGFGLAGAIVLGSACGLLSASSGASNMVIDLGVESTVVICFGMATTFGSAYGMILQEVTPTSMGENAVSGLLFGVGFLFSYLRIFSYPIDLTLSIISYVTSKGNPTAAKRAWRWCPVSWNEMIWLPVPFAGKLLAALALEDRNAGFDQIEVFARERMLERSVAITAVAETALSDLEAKTLDSLADISDRIEWTTHPPVELLGEFQLALPRIDRMAQHAMQYLTLTGPHRKRQALKGAIEEVGALHHELVFQRGRFVPRLIHATHQWRRLLEDENRLLASRKGSDREIPNPFVFGNAVLETENNIFVGRRDIVRKIEASILNTQQAPTLLLHGARRMGKTSILNQLSRLLGHDFVPVIIDCQNPAIVGSVAALLQYLTREICESLRRRRVTVGLLRTADPSEPFAVFDSWLRETELALPERMRILLCLDEYERFKQALDAGWGEKVLDEFRHILQHHPRFILLFGGAHSFHELGPAWTDRFISARSIRVSFLQRDEVIPLLTKPVPDFDLTYAAGALDAVIDATCGQPFLTQAVAFELVELLNERHRKQATLEDVDEAIARALVRATAYFADVWTSARSDGQAVMLGIIRNDGFRENSSAQRWLREQDVLNDDGTFAVPMMKMWVGRKALQYPT